MNDFIKIEIPKILSYQTLVFKNGKNTFKKTKYKEYELMIKNQLYSQKKYINIDFTKKYNLYVKIIFLARSKKIGDLDNISKPILDILEDVFVFNDRNIVDLHIKKSFDKNLKNDIIKIKIGEINEQN